MSNAYRQKPQGRRGVRRQPSFVMVPPDETEDDISCFTIVTNMGVPLLYIVASACLITGIICMSVITKYWGTMNPPQCFLYSSTPTTDGEDGYAFGTYMSSCYWVAYGTIPALIACIICGILYSFHVKDDKYMNNLSLGVIVAMTISTILVLSVACTLAQGVRITCASVSFTKMNNIGRKCGNKIDTRAEAQNFPVKTSAMISATTATLWTAFSCMLLICAFHFALFIRRRTRRYDDY